MFRISLVKNKTIIDYIKWLLVFYKMVISFKIR